MQGFFHIHGLLVVDLPAVIVPVLLMLWIPGTAFAAVALAVNRGKGARGLWILTGSVLAALGLTGALLRDMNAAMLLGGMGAGVCAAARVVYWRASRRQVQAVNRRASLAAPSPNSFVEAAIAGGAFAGAGLATLAAAVFALTL